MIGDSNCNIDRPIDIHSIYCIPCLHTRAVILGVHFEMCGDRYTVSQILKFKFSALYDQNGRSFRFNL